ncbi:MAG: VanZ family protein [Nitrospira sp.]|nr:VanZ family protein [Nitrospira sp.]
MWLTFWILYSFLILASGVYGSDFVGHSHWDYVIWIPPFDEIRSLQFWLDIIVNVALYAPLAVLFLQHRNSNNRSALLTAVIVGLLLSCTVELYQVYSHNRRPSPLDIVCNLSGTILGALLWQVWRKSLGQPAQPKAPAIPIP